MGDLTPQPFGRYLLRERVGRGGMAEVFRASLPGFGGFDKTLAIKRMFREFGHDPTFVEMLTDEAKIVSLLAHPNIVQIFDVGREGDDYFMAFEYVDGVDLFAVLQRHHETDRNLPVPLACYIVAELCSALDHAHSRRNRAGETLGIIHRDVSPQNVLLSMLGEVKLTDFGIAKAAHRLAQTQAGMVKGKIYYMAPEQVLGQPTDHRVDLFAAGILLYEALTTRPLYDEPDQRKLLDVVGRAEYAWPQNRVADIAPQLRQLVDKALEPRPQDRFQTGQQMRAAIVDAMRSLGGMAERDELGQYLRAMYQVEPDRPPTVIAHMHKQPEDLRWNSRVDVPLPGQLAADGPTHRDPAMPPKLPPPTKPLPPASGPPPVPVVTAVPERQPQIRMSAPAPVPTLVPRAPPASVAPQRPSPAPPQPIAIAGRSSPPPMPATDTKPPIAPRPPAEAKPLADGKLAPDGRPSSEALPALRTAPKPLPRPVVAPPPVPTEPPPLPGSDGEFGDEITGPPALPPSKNAAPPPADAPPASAQGPTGSSPGNPAFAVTTPSPKPPPSRPPPSRPAVPAVAKNLSSSQTAAVSAPAKPAVAAGAAEQDEATRELSTSEIARRIGLAESFDAVASSEPTSAMPAVDDDVVLDATTKPQRKNQPQAAGGAKPQAGNGNGHPPAPQFQPAPMPLGRPPMHLPPLDEDDMPASPGFLAATAIVWVVAVVLAVYATLVTVRHGG